MHLPKIFKATSLLLTSIAFVGAVPLVLPDQDNQKEPERSELFFDEDISEWFNRQVPYAEKSVLANISPPGTQPGVVIAATSTVNPPYYFHWTRDAALTMDVINTIYQSSNDSAFEKMMWDYALFSRSNQLQPGCNPPGAECWALGGPGEPKYLVDGTVYKGSWGRPQNDGPALRASTLIRFASAYLKKGGSVQKVIDTLYDSRLPTKSVIKTDLEFVANHWHEKNFDLWEEVYAQHFFTRMVQRRSLLEGADLATEMGDIGAANWYKRQANAISTVLEKHWDPSAGYIREMIETPGYLQRSGKNIATVLAVIHGYNDDGFFGPSDDRVLASVAHLVRDFDEIYRINDIKMDSDGRVLGTSFGRYKEDVYDGGQTFDPTKKGNPWYLTTLAVAELNYKLIQEYIKAQNLIISEYSLPYFKSIGMTGLRAGQRIEMGSAEFVKVISSISKSAESLVRRVKFHIGEDFKMDEQFNRDSGEPMSAENLTWSYASVLTTFKSRLQAGKMMDDLLK